jgi:hypothetical protein
MTTIGQLDRLKIGIEFKKYLLSVDVPSRKVIIEKLIQYMSQTPDDDMKGNCMHWLENIRNINDTFDSVERKEQMRYDACWDELHTTLIRSASFLDAIKVFTK